MEKTPGDIIILHAYQKLLSDDVRFLRMVRDRRMDEQTDGKSDIWRWVPHLKIIPIVNSNKT